MSLYVPDYTLIFLLVVGNEQINFDGFITLYRGLGPRYQQQLPKHGPCIDDLPTKNGHVPVRYVSVMK